MPNIGPLELIVILGIALLILGPGRLPDVGAALGKSIREFRKAATDVQDAVKLDTPPASTTPTAVPDAPAAPAAPVPNTLAATAEPNTLAPAAPAATAGEVVMDAPADADADAVPVAASTETQA
jgi:sec-independent protein translocase protein TatA